MTYRSAAVLATTVLLLAACDGLPTPDAISGLPDDAIAGAPVSLAQGPPAGTVFIPHTPSQQVACNQIDNALAKIPHGDGISPLTEAEIGPGGVRFSGGGGSFVTFAYVWDGTEYVVDAGRSAAAGNSAIINDYPALLDLPQSSESDQVLFKRQSGEIILGGGDQFQLPGQGTGQVRIGMTFVGEQGGARIYEGCAKTPQLTNFGFTVKEDGDFVQQEYFKAWASTNADFEVLEYEWTEVSTFKNTDPSAF